VVALVFWLITALTSCSDDPNDDGAEDKQVAAVLTPLEDDPAAARALMTGQASGTLADDAASAGIPEDGTVAWLMGDRGFSDGTLHAVAGALDAAGHPAPGDDDEQVVAEIIGHGQVPDGLREAAAVVLAARADDAFASSTGNAPWSPDDLTRLLIDVGGDPAARESLADAFVDHARPRLGGRGGAEVGQPLGALLGALDVGALGSLGGDPDGFEFRKHVDQRRLALETLAERAVLESGGASVAAEAAAARTGGAYTTGLDAALDSLG
jgi:hypothetical protein